LSYQSVIRNTIKLLKAMFKEVRVEQILSFFHESNNNNKEYIKIFIVCSDMTDASQ